MLHPAIVAQSDPVAQAYPELATITGIVGFVLIVVQILKYLVRDVPIASAVPTWVYAMGVSVLATLFSVYVLCAMSGPIGPAIYQAALAAATASGFHSWLSNIKDNPKAKAAPLIGLLLVGASLTGCAAFQPAEKFESDRARVAAILADEYAAYKIAASHVADLVESGLVTKSKARSVLPHMIVVYDGLRHAEALLEAGDVAAAEAQLKLTHQLTQQIEVWVEQLKPQSQLKGTADDPVPNLHHGEARDEQRGGARRAHRPMAHGPRDHRSTGDRCNEARERRGPGRARSSYAIA